MLDTPMCLDILFPMGWKLFTTLENLTVFAVSVVYRFMSGEIKEILKKENPHYKSDLRPFI
jgi:hypothetical protein